MSIVERTTGLYARTRVNRYVCVFPFVMFTFNNCCHPANKALF